MSKDGPIEWKKEEEVVEKFSAFAESVKSVLKEIGRNAQSILKLWRFKIVFTKLMCEMCVCVCVATAVEMCVLKCACWKCTLNVS